MPESKKDLFDRIGRYTDRVPNPTKPGKFYKYTPKEIGFVNAYLGEAKFVQSQAAKLAGYDAQTDTVFRNIGCNLMKKPHIRAAIDAAMAAMTMPKHEILYRLGRIAAGSLEDVMNDDNELDLEMARKNNTAHLLKKIKITRSKRDVKRVEIDAPDDAEPEYIESDILDETIHFEIHDPLKALELLGKANAMFIDRAEHTGKDGVPLNQPPEVVIYLPDNGRGDAGKPAKPARKARAARTEATAKKKR
jgi:phage terminase small subunit